MNTSYIKFSRVHNDAVWGMEESCVRSQLVRCTRNRLRKAQFEWVGTGRLIPPDQLAWYRKHYPLTIRMELE